MAKIAIKSNRSKAGRVKMTKGMRAALHASMVRPNRSVLNPPFNAPKSVDLKTTTKRLRRLIPKKGN